MSENIGFGPPPPPPLPPRKARGMAEAALPFLPHPPNPQPFPPLAPLSRPNPRPRAPARDPVATPPDPGLARHFGIGRCLALGVLPWRNAGPETLVLVESLARFTAARAELAACFGPLLRPVAVPRTALQRALLAHFGADLALRAETRVPLPESCRRVDARRLRHASAALAALGLALCALNPLASLITVFALATLALTLNTAFRIATAIATLRTAKAPPPPALPTDDLPAVTLLIALYREADIAPRLLRRLERLDYPRDRLELLLVVEDDDTATRTALENAQLQPWMRTISAPAGTIRTKPRALNLALDLAQGDIIGVYDAEDAPEPDQLRKVAAAFAAGPPDLACVQAVLGFYNPEKNWLSRCFTLEYAMWFRLVLSGIERLGLPVPLGGTSVFLKRDILDALGGWDAHNVTEDADLGIRLARHGHKTRVIDSLTQEEANCRALPWIRQRSRWIKGYMLTWLVHMRHPALLWRQLGPRGFAGFQLVFFGSLAQVFLVPLLWSLWAVPLGFDHPVVELLPPHALPALAAVFVLSGATNSLFHLIALRRSGQRVNAWWILSLPLYFPLGTLAALKALAEMLVSPFYWDKTTHGHLDE